MARPQANLSIIECGPQDIGSLTPLFDAYRRFYKEDQDLAGAKRFLLERLSKKESRIFLAKEGAACLGFVQLYPSFSSTAMKRLWILNDLFVAPAARRRGVAQALMERAKSLAVETGAEGLILETAVDNHDAQRVYERLGWKRDEKFHRYSLDV